MIMQDITMIENPNVTTDDTVDSQSLHIAVGGEQEANGEVDNEADSIVEENGKRDEDTESLVETISFQDSASLFNLDMHDNCAVMENKMADDAI